MKHETVTYSCDTCGEEDITPRLPAKVAIKGVVVTTNLILRDSNDLPIARETHLCASCMDDYRDKIANSMVLVLPKEKM